MVYAFLISTATSAEFSLLYHAVFGSEDVKTDDTGDRQSADESQQQVPPPATAVCEASRKKRHQTMAAVLERVRKNYELNMAVGSGSPLGNFLLSSPQYGIAEDRLEIGGLFTLVQEDDHPKTVIWHALENGLCFVLICNHQENRIMASKVLKHMVASIVEQAQNYNAQEVFRGVSLISAAVDVFLPSGQVIFMHSHMIKQLTIRLRNIMKGVND